jgi:hypothetical protein
MIINSCYFGGGGVGDGGEGGGGVCVFPLFFAEFRFISCVFIGVGNLLWLEFSF